MVFLWFGKKYPGEEGVKTLPYLELFELETRLELATYALQVRCATNCATPAFATVGLHSVTTCKCYLTGFRGTKRVAAMGL